MKPADRTEYIVLALREAARMYEGDARALLAEHDALVRAEALDEAIKAVESKLLAGESAVLVGHRAGISDAVAAIRKLTLNGGDPR